MKLYGQRWEYALEGWRSICVDNAFDIWGRGNERLLIDGQSLLQETSWMKRRTTLRHELEDGRFFCAELAGGLVTIRCEATLDGLPITPARILQAKWRGAQDSWPAETAWSTERTLIPTR